MHLSTQTIEGLTTNILVMAPSFDSATLSRAVTFAVALAVLLVAHQIGDHVVQTDYQAGAKAGSGWPAVAAMAGHVTTYHVWSFGVLVGAFALLGLPLTLPGLTAGLLFSAGTHALVDRRWPVRALLRALGSPRFAEAQTPVCGMYAADQALHQFALLISALLIAAL